MKYNRLYNRYITVLTIGLLITNTNAQNTTSGFFCDGYLYRHEMNPAVANKENYVAMPALGNIAVGVVGNAGLDNFVFSRGGKTVLFTNPQVSSEDFMKNIHDRNKIVSDIKLDIFSLGLKAKNSYNTFGINLKANVGACLPGELFRMAKEGPQNKTYDISSLSAHADAFIEIALGHCRVVNDKWNFGGKLKFLLGGANLDAQFEKAQFVLGEDSWNAICDAKVQNSVKGLSYKINETMRGPKGDEKLHRYVNGMDFENPGLNGLGAALDLGTTYSLNEDWSFGASLLDLGFINWKNNLVASTNGEQMFKTDSYIFSSDKNQTNSFENEMNRFAEDLSLLYEMHDNGNQGGRTRALGATLNFFAEYKCPFYSPLSIGLLNTTRIHGDFSWTEFRLSANVAPSKIFSASINFAEGTFGSAFGWLLNLHPKGFNIFVGMDHTFISLTKQGIPLNNKASFNMGVNFSF